MFGYVITCQDQNGDIRTVSDGGFESYDEAKMEADDMWCQLDEDCDGIEPIDFEIYEG